MLLGTAAPGALMERTSLAGWVPAGAALFCAARLYVQFFVYSASHWRSRRFERNVPIAFSLLWMFYTDVFGLCFAWRREWLR